MFQSLKQLYWDIKYGPKRVLSLRKEGIEHVLEILGRQWRWKRHFLSRYEKIFYFKRFEESFSEADKRYFLEQQFKEHLGYSLNLDNPQTFNEKIQWLKLYYHNPLMTQCADKVGVRQYVSEKIGEQYLVPIHGIYTNPDEIDFDALPNQFVLKVNWGSGQNIICKDKTQLDIEDIKSKLKEWIQPHNNLYYLFLEWGYKNIQPKIICEQYLEQLDTCLIDYKFVCCNGTPSFFWIDTDRFTEHKRTFYDFNWNRRPIRLTYPTDIREYPRPQNLDRMTELACILSANLPLARVDFYNVNEKIYFGEITYYTGAGYERFSPPEWDLKLGNMLQLPEVTL